MLRRLVDTGVVPAEESVLEAFCVCWEIAVRWTGLRHWLPWLAPAVTVEERRASNAAARSASFSCPDAPVKSAAMKGDVFNAKAPDRRSEKLEVHA